MIKANPIIQSIILFLLFHMGWLVNVYAQNQSRLDTVATVDLDRHLGQWHEIARLPNRFQDQCVGQVTAEYKPLDNGMIQVINRCLDEQGNVDKAVGIARITDHSSQAKLEVSFVSLFGWNLFWGDYWIIGLGEDYEYAVVGMPSRRYAWVLSRTTVISQQQWQTILQVLQRSGYNPEKFIMTNHINPATK
jgi:apolipoprotein D and lipocalin family protein